MARARSRRSAPRRGPRLGAATFRRHLLDKAARVAPGDLTDLLARADTIRARLATEAEAHPAFAERGRLALALLADHAAGRCPQVPYQTVSLLAAALFYYLDPVDAVPDCIPRRGTGDDALVLELAWRLGNDGVGRWLAATGRG